MDYGGLEVATGTNLQPDVALAKALQSPHVCGRRSFLSSRLSRMLTVLAARLELPIIVYISPNAKSAHPCTIASAAYAVHDIKCI